MISSQCSSFEHKGTPEVSSPIFISEPGPLAEAVLRAWLASGRLISEVWTSDPERLSRSLGRNAISFRDIGTPKTPLPDPPPFADTLLTVFTLHIIPPRLIERFGDRAVNLHPALLPFYKGPVPRQAMMKDGKADLYGGVTAHVLQADIDQGPIIAQAPVPLGPKETGPAWEYRLALAAARLLVTDVVAYLDGQVAAVPQDPKKGFYRKRLEREFLIDSEKTTADVKEILSTGRRMSFVCRPVGGFPGRPQTLVNRFGRRVGPPTGKAPVWTPFFAELDLADARVRLLRPSPVDKLTAAIRRHRRVWHARVIGRATHI
jgi:methionyl-tRNA formyltransferase